MNEDFDSPTACQPKGIHVRNCKDLTGLKFDRWTVLSIGPSGKNKRYLCRCTCGKTRMVRGDVLRNGGSRSCGCLAVELFGARNTTHGLSRHPIYLAYQSMMTRCYRRNTIGWANYGGRGICVSDSWHTLTCLIRGSQD